MASIDLKKIFKSEGEVDQKIYLALIKAIKDRHQEGFDYLRFKQSVNHLQEMDLDEETSIKSAYITASTMGLTKSKLTNSIRHYLTILGKEKESFAEALQNQFSSKVEGKKIEADKLEKKIEEYKKKIVKMQEEMSLYQSKIDSVDEEMKIAKSKIEKTRDNFEITYESLIEMIQTDLSKIDSLL
jgi:chromosome segregation ATPase